MTTYRYQNQDQWDFITEPDRIDITDYVHTFVRAYNKKYDVKLKTGYLGGAEYLKGLLNASQDKVVPYLEKLEGLFYWNSQKVDFVPSNLGENKGYLFYFICAYCDSRVKLLFRRKICEQPACRTCCDIGYKPTQSRRQVRRLSRLIHKPYLHSEDKQALIKYAGITKEDIPEDLEREKENNDTETAIETPKAWQEKKEMPLDKPAEPTKPLAQIIYRKTPTNSEYGKYADF
jgi:hypothetical protein